MYLKTLLAHFFSLFAGLTALTNAKPVFPTSVIPAINKRDLIGLLVGENAPTDSGLTPPSSLDPQHTPPVSPVEPSRLRPSSVESSVVTAVTYSLTPTLPSSTVKSSIDTTIVVQTAPPEYQGNVLPPPSNPMTSGWVGDVSATPPGELTEWKVIGIGVITVALIAILVLSISFFDSWWGFLRAVACGKRADKGEGEETMVPDEVGLRKSWEFKLASEDGHRYPTLSSAESI